VSAASCPVFSMEERQTRAGCRRSIQSFFPSLERQTRAREERLDRPPDRRRLCLFSARRKHRTAHVAGATTSHRARSERVSVARCLQRNGDRLAPYPPTYATHRIVTVRSGSGATRNRLPAPCDVRGLARERAQAPAHKRPIQGLSPSACLPFQARGKTLDRPPALYHACAHSRIAAGTAREQSEVVSRSGRST
jgi:hypothetical protein